MLSPQPLPPGKPLLFLLQVTKNSYFYILYFNLIKHKISLHIPLLNATLDLAAIVNKIE